MPNQGDTAKVLVYFQEDVNVGVQHESGFSAVMVVPSGMCAACNEGFTQESPCSANANRKCKACAAPCAGLNE